MSGKRLLRACLLSLLCIGACLTDASGQKKYETRAVWLTTVFNLDWPKRATFDGKSQQRELDHMLDRLEEAGFNTVYLQVRGRGDLIYPSSVEPFSPIFTGSSSHIPDYDPLAYAVEACHRRGMRIHAWLVTLPLGSTTNVRALGREAYATRHRSDCIRYRGEWYMDPAKKETGEHLARIVEELVGRYKIDGVHLDYIRYPDPAKSFPDEREYRHSSSGPKGKVNKEIWRTQNISRIVHRIREVMQHTDPSVELSVAPIGKYRRIDSARGALHWYASESVHQDAVAWATAGDVDALVPMIYYRGVDFYPFVQDWLRLSSKPVVVGIGAYRTLAAEGGWSVRDLEEQVHSLQADSLVAGIAFFRAEHVVGSRHQELYKALRDSLFKAPALPKKGKVSESSTCREITLQVEPKGLRVTWQDRAKADEPHSYTVYLTTEGDYRPTSTAAPLIVTQKREVLIPTGTLRPEQIYHVRIGRYLLKSGEEDLSEETPVIYLSREEK